MQKIPEKEVLQIKQKINELITTMLLNGVDVITKYENGDFPRSDKVKDLQTRFCFDLAHAASIDIPRLYELYDCNDNHVYTALKQACPKVERKYTGGN